MKKFIRDYPTAAILLLLLACIRFEFYAPTWEVKLPGLVAGLFVLCVIAVVLLFRIFNTAHEACVRKGLILQHLHFRYDVLVPIAIVAALIHGYWQGAEIIGTSRKPVPQWIFAWSDPKLAFPFIGAIIGVVLLHRVYSLVRAVNDSADSR